MEVSAGKLPDSDFIMRLDRYVALDMRTPSSNSQRCLAHPIKDTTAKISSVGIILGELHALPAPASVVSGGSEVYHGTIGETSGSVG